MKHLFKIILSSLPFFLFYTFSHGQAPSLQWQKCLGGGTNDECYFIGQTNDGGYIATGWTTSNNTGNVTGYHGNIDNWVAKLDSTGALQWQKCLGGSNQEAGYSVCQSPDGGFMVAGYTASNDGDATGCIGGGTYDAWIVKLDVSGNILWKDCLGRGLAYTIKPTPDGGYIIGAAGGDTTVNGYHLGTGAWDVLIIKIDSIGNVQWKKCYGGTGNEGGIVNNQYYTYDPQLELVFSNDGGYVIATTTKSDDGDISGSYNAGGDFWVFKIDSIGNFEWQKCLGGTNYDYAHSVTNAYDGGYLIAGTTRSVDGDVSGLHDSLAPYYDVWVAKIDSIGFLQWQKCLGGTYNEAAFSVHKSIDGNYVVAGQTNSDDGDVYGNHLLNFSDYWIVKLDTAGNIIWQKCLGSSDHDIAYSMQPTQDGGYVLGGYASANGGNVSGLHYFEDYWIAKLGPPPPCSNVTFSYAPYDCDTIQFIMDAGGTSIYSIDWYKDLSLVSSTDTALVKLIYDSLQLNDKQFYTITGKAIGSNCISSQTFQFNDSAYFSVILDTTGSVNTWYAYPFTNTNVVSQLWDFGDGNTSTLPFPTHVYATAGFYSVCHTVTLSSGCSYPYCLNQSFYRMNQQGIFNFVVVGPTSIQEHENFLNLNISPNPASGKFTIQSATEKISQINITNISGQAILKKDLTNSLLREAGGVEIDLTNQPKGIYLIQVVTGKEVYNQKMIVE